MAQHRLRLLGLARHHRGPDDASWDGNYATWGRDHSSWNRDYTSGDWDYSSRFRDYSSRFRNYSSRFRNYSSWNWHDSTWDWYTRLGQELARVRALRRLRARSVVSPMIWLRRPDLAALSPGVSWWYNWTSAPNAAVPADYATQYAMDYYPMLWNGNSMPMSIVAYLKANPQSSTCWF